MTSPHVRAKSLRIEGYRYKKQLKAVTKEAEKYKDKLQKLSSFEQLEKESFPADLSYQFGKALNEIILFNYVKGRKEVKSMGRAPLQKAKTNIILESVDVEFDWELEDVEALNAFRNQAFEVANVNSTETLSMLKQEAEKAISEGIPFQEFRKNIQLKGFDAKNPYHLRTNFNTAVNNAYESGRWKEFQELKDIFPNLQYNAVMDERTRDDHAALNGIVRPVDDPFWDTYMPPNDWNCRCSVSQKMANETTKKELNKPIPSINLPKEWQKNSGKTNDIWQKWLGGKELKPTDWKEANLRPIQEMVKKGVKAPDLLTFSSIEEYKNYFNKNIVGNYIDFTGNPYIINEEFFTKIISKGSRTQQRLERMDWLKPIIEDADEIWGQSRKNANYQTYIKAFKDTKGGFGVINMKNGLINTYFEADSFSYVDSHRNGILLYSKEK